MFTVRMTIVLFRPNEKSGNKIVDGDFPHGLRNGFQFEKNFPKLVISFGRGLMPCEVWVLEVFFSCEPLAPPVLLVFTT